MKSWKNKHEKLIRQWKESKPTLWQTNVAMENIGKWRIMA